MKEHHNVAPHAPAIHGDVRVSGGRSLDQDQNRKRLDLNGSCAHFIVQYPKENEPTKELNEHQEKKKGTEVDERTVDLYNRQGNTDITEHETTQCENCKEHIAKGKVMSAQVDNGGHEMYDRYSLTSCPFGIF